MTRENPGRVDGSLLIGKEKEDYVRGMFDRIAVPYDRLNQTISMGRADRWRRRALDFAGVQPGMAAVDLGTGTGDLLLLLRERLGPGARLAGIDIAEGMLEIARRKWKERHGDEAVRLAIGSALESGLEPASFDLATMGWVLRNVADRAAAYREVLRLLKPGGLFVCIEMSRPESAIVRAANAAYVRLLMPMLARFRGGDLEAYRYLAASTGRFPRAAALAAEWQEAGFEGVRHESLMAGAIAIHVGRKGA